MHSVGKILAAVSLVAVLGAETALPQEPEVTVLEAAIARSVVDRAAVDSGTTFPADVGQLFAWTRTRVSGDGESTIRHVWFHGDEEMADIELTVRGSGWRTWSSKSIVPEWTGDWRVEVRDAADEVIATLRFTVGGMKL